MSVVVSCQKSDFLQQVIFDSVYLNVQNVGECCKAQTDGGFFSVNQGNNAIYKSHLFSLLLILLRCLSRFHTRAASAALKPYQ